MCGYVVCGVGVCRTVGVSIVVCGVGVCRTVGVGMLCVHEVHVCWE